MNETLLKAWHEQFSDQGFVILKGFFDLRLVQQARDALNQLVDQHAEKLLAAGKIASPLTDAPFELRLLQLYQDHLAEAPNLLRRELHLAGLFDLFFHPGLLDIVETFLGPEIRLYPNYSVRPKLPDHAPTEVLWHQDGGYTQGQVEMLRMVNVWTPLVPARVENGCMQFIPHTQQLGPVLHEKREYFLEISPSVLAPYLNQVILIELDPGDVVLFHNLLFHRGLPNHSDKIRWSADWRYQDATQPTLRKENGHMARSHSHPEQAVQNAAQWASLVFG